MLGPVIMPRQVLGIITNVLEKNEILSKITINVIFVEETSQN